MEPLFCWEIDMQGRQFTSPTPYWAGSISPDEMDAFCGIASKYVQDGPLQTIAISGPTSYWTATGQVFYRPVTFVAKKAYKTLDEFMPMELARFKPKPWIHKVQPSPEHNAFDDHTRVFKRLNNSIGKSTKTIVYGEPCNWDIIASSAIPQPGKYMLVRCDDLKGFTLDAPGATFEVMTPQPLQHQ